MMLFRILALFFVVCAAVCAAEFSMKELSIPQFDASGRLLRRLTAVSATGTPDLPLLRNGAVEFYPTEKGEIEKLGTLDFDDALFHRPTGVIDSEGRVRFVSLQGKLAGIGFRYELASGQLVLKSSIVMDLPTAHVTASQAEATLAQPASAHDLIISHTAMHGGVVVTEIKSEKYKFDRAETASAIYTAIDDTLTLASPVTTWSKGVKAIISGQAIQIKMGRTNSTSMPASTGVR